MSEIIEVDGSLLEGGGQILRVALTLSAVKKIPVRITNIRGGRTKPGLMEQHLKGIELVKNICNANVKGVAFGSTEIEFWPGDLRGGSYRSQVKTAGSISLLLQVALPCSLFANSPTTLTLIGGTNAEMAPQIDYTTEVFRPILEKFGATFDFQLLKRGYFPKGGGEVIVHITPIQNLNPIDMTEQGKLATIYGWSFVAGVLPIGLAHRMADSAISSLQTICQGIQIERYKEDKTIAPDNCAGMVFQVNATLLRNNVSLVAETDTKCILGTSAIGKRTEKTEETGKKAAELLIAAFAEGACVDQFCQDQIIILMALASGKSRVKVGSLTMHTQTAIYVAELLANVKFDIIPQGTANIIECSGL